MLSSPWPNVKKSVLSPTYITRTTILSHSIQQNLSGQQSNCFQYAQELDLLLKRDYMWELYHVRGCS